MPAAKTRSDTIAFPNLGATEEYNFVPGQVECYCSNMHAFTLLLTAASAVLGVVASPTTIKTRQGIDYVGYLISTFSDAKPQIQQYLSNGNSASSFTFLNGGEPILASTVGTKGVRDIFLATNGDRSQYYLIATGKSSS